MDLTLGQKAYAGLHVWLVPVSVSFNQMYWAHDGPDHSISRKHCIILWIGKNSEYAKPGAQYKPTKSYVCYPFSPSLSFPICNAHDGVMNSITNLEPTETHRP